MFTPVLAQLFIRVLPINWFRESERENGKEIGVDGWMDGEIVDCTVVWYRMYFPNLFVVNSVIHLLVEIIIIIIIK